MKKVKVILADANENSRSSIRELLELDNSIDVLAEAANGKEVIDKIKSMEPEVVIMDLNMPEMDGIETTRYITINYPQVFVIIISVNDDTASFRQAMLAGAKEYLVKPLSAVELNRSVKEVAVL
ncbi:MAG: response regulator transcription factor, partial [Syntrophomonas sp.]|nr:response regulator transcription factor [Syntrophomonas sp.]